ncbi:hypothetical protein [Actinoplanes sp. URMC 104]|uniref:hypothetical protein n=1 Tax=Actinoplanes sp. URMC 104 TaxID=3423409 RepID=UPI003F19F9C0
MPRTPWDELPAELREKVTAHTGGVDQVEPVTAGSVADFAATLTTGGRRVFCKGSRLDTERVGFLRTEIRLNEHLPADLTPRLQWTTEMQGWLIAGFDHVPGAPADLRPGSPDLPAVAAALTSMAQTLTPAPAVDVQPATARWGGLLNPALVDGDTLLHTDMTHNNFLVSGARSWVVDWSMPCRGAVWIDTARMLIRLIRAGHTAADAEAWAAALPMWEHASSEALDAFARAAATVSRRLRDRNPSAPHLVEMAAAGRAWVEHRHATA